MILKLILKYWPRIIHWLLKRQDKGRMADDGMSIDFSSGNKPSRNRTRRSGRRAATEAGAPVQTHPVELNEDTGRGVIEAVALDGGARTPAVHVDGADFACRRRLVVPADHLIATCVWQLRFIQIF